MPKGNTEAGKRLKNPQKQRGNKWKKHWEEASALGGNEYKAQWREILFF